MAKRPRYSPETRRRAIWLVHEQEKMHRSQWAAIASIAEKGGCAPQTLQNWIQRRDVGARTLAGVTTDEQARVNALERENRELRRANEILRKAATYFAQPELDRRET